MSQWTAAKRTWAMCRKLSGIRGGSPLPLFLDAAWCGYRHGASPENYFVLRFFDLPERERKTYLTSGRSKALDRALNAGARPEDRQVLANKALFDRQFSELVRRDFFYPPEAGFPAFEAFLERHGEFVLKPVSGIQGRGIELIETRALSDPEAFYRRCREEQFLLEERIRQHPALDRIDPYSLNSVRVNAARDRQGRVRLIGACLKAGTGQAVSDNFHAGGLAYPLDLNTGRVCGPGRNNRDLNEYIHHPGSLLFMPGFQVPYWAELLSAVEKAMELVPSLGYVGWDIAVTPEGPELIEGNFNWPGGNIIQFDKRGKVPDLLDCLRETL